MLDTETKRRIDTARDILVGKIPDPKSQVELITIALIYKFMDDMDAEAEELGGKRKFFTGDFARYGWAKLMRSGFGGYETLNLYTEALDRMPENPGIPLLFRNIFKNAFLPFRDPETLRMFLKIIDEFVYDHSERLGDAFEYLLSVLGSQGDAGQFRTPRHIIDFIVGIVDPKKHETVIDPACGTAGFLISSYKHILKTNQDSKGHSLLTPDEKGSLAGNFKGYDISPDMVRLSLVNLYLHGFTDPHIYEYDTLTSEDRWNEYADIILANPPFMSPKGGIKPHNRFSVQAKRSEVLFVDYIAEHLTPNGRAGIIVPEGIIFQSQSAYKELRKMLVDDYLVAVISLPAGVFNPYSGVKTSILILDKALSRRTDTITFFKIENDGFNLGAQRRPISEDDLPQVQAEINDYLGRLRAGLTLEHFKPSLALVIPKEKIATNGDYYLSGERYQKTQPKSSKFPLVRIGEVVETITPPIKIQKTSYEKSGCFPVIDQSQADVAGWTNQVEAIIRPTKPLVIFGDHTCAVKFIEMPFAQGADGIKIIQTVDILNPSFLFFLLKSNPLESNGYQRHFTKLKEKRIPLPPLEVQEEIVREIEGYQKIIDGARMVIENYRPQIPIDPSWPMEPIGNLFLTKSGTTPARNNDLFFKDGDIPWVKTLDLNDGPILKTQERITPLALKETNLFILPKGTVLIAMYGGFNQIGRTGVLEIEATHNQAMTALLPNPKIDPYFLINILNNSKEHWKRIANSTRKDPNITKKDILSLKIPTPSIKDQHALVLEIKAEQKLVDSNLDLMSIMERKIKATIDRVQN
ncbi:MAG: N-6 DNA methylase [Synergistales bacterium]